MADFCHLKASRLTDYYKNHLSSYTSWKQGKHAHTYLYFPRNIGSNISIDETAFDNGELYTILTNKAGRGKKGSIIAIIKGTQSDIVSKYICQIPEHKRLEVKTITLDMASSMYNIARVCFPKATQIIDRFHVQKLMYDALQALRVEYRWKALADENKAIWQAKNSNTKFSPKIFSNGDTLKQLLARSRYILFKAPTKWNQRQAERAKILFDNYKDIQEFYYLSLELGKIYSSSYHKSVARVKLALWFNKVEDKESLHFRTVINTFKNHYERILNFFESRLTNASAESFNAKLKHLRATFRGISDPKFFLFRATELFA